MKQIFLDESGETIYRPAKDNRIFGLGGLIVNSDEELSNLFEQLEPFLHDGELKYEYYKDHINELNEIIQIINSSGIEYHIEIVQPYLYYYTLLIDYLLFPYWIYNTQQINKIKKDFFYLLQDSFDKIPIEEIKNFFLISSVDDYVIKGKSIIEKLKSCSVSYADEIFDDMISDLQITYEKINNHNFSIEKIKPIPDKIGDKKKNIDIFFLYHLQCLYNFLEKYSKLNFIHDENQRLHNYILKTISEKYPRTNFIFKDSKTDKGLIIIDCLVSYYTHAVIDINTNINRGLLFNPKSYNLILQNDLLNKVQLMHSFCSLFIK